jgi:predicted  nucleic acid-binding Zn-ribbon protein
VKKEDERLREELKNLREKLERLEKGEILVGETLEMLKKQMKVIEKLIEDNKNLADKGLFEAIGRGLDKLVDNSLKAVIEVTQLLNKCPIS